MQKKIDTQKRIAYVYGRPALNSAKLLYMPFGLNVVKKLAETDCLIDLYVTQNYTDEYKKNLPTNVTIIFLEYQTVWNYGMGKGLYYLLNFYFSYITRLKKYDSVWGIGQAGTVLGGKLAQKNKAPFYYLSDEFPNISYLKIWRDAEKKYASTAQFFVVPDETRLAVTTSQIPALKHIQGFTLPNIPLIKEVTIIANTNWYNRLYLSTDKKIVVYAGGIAKENQIDYVLSIFPLTSSEFILVMVGNSGKYKNSEELKHPRILWIEEELPDEELHSLIKQAVCCLCYYADFSDLEYVGKSSGKLMRSLLFETPVISTRFDSLKFVEEDCMGILIDKPYQLIEAIYQIANNIDSYRDSIKKNIPKYYFEKYWEILMLD